VFVVAKRHLIFPWKYPRGESWVAWQSCLNRSVGNLFFRLLLHGRSRLRCSVRRRKAFVLEQVSGNGWQFVIAASRLLSNNGGRFYDKKNWNTVFSLIRLAILCQIVIWLFASNIKVR